jgi:hypothetical protein
MEGGEEEKRKGGCLKVRGMRPAPLAADEEDYYKLV